MARTVMTKLSMCLTLALVGSHLCSCFVRESNPDDQQGSKSCQSTMTMKDSESDSQPDKSCSEVSPAMSTMGMGTMGMGTMGMGTMGMGTMGMGTMGMGTMGMGTMGMGTMGMGTMGMGTMGMGTMNTMNTMSTPSCSSQCYEAGQVYEQGDTWTRTCECQTCECEAGGVIECHPVCCPEPECPACFQQVPEGGCCAVCKGCEDSAGTWHHIGDVWSAGCHQYTCLPCGTIVQTGKAADSSDSN